MKKKLKYSFQYYIDKAIYKFKNKTYLIDENNPKNNIRFSDLNKFLIKCFSVASFVVIVVSLPSSLPSLLDVVNGSLSIVCT